MTMTTVKTWGGMLTASARLLPDYLIVGGKRCGTTSLQAAIAAHPAVLPPHSGKGTRYFDVNYDKGFRWFRGHYPTQLDAHYRGSRAGSPVISGEASPYYCFHPAAFERIAARLPEVKILFVLREPVQRTVSHYHWEVRHGFESLSLADALNQEEERLTGERERLLADDSYRSFAHRHWSYQARGQYADQLDEAHRWFAPEQIRILRFEEFFADPAANVGEVYDFLGLDDFALPAFPSLERGGEPVPDDAVRQQLQVAFERSNAILAERYGVEYG
jgi:hypothetical protein